MIYETIVSYGIIGKVMVAMKFVMNLMVGRRGCQVVYCFRKFEHQIDKNTSSLFLYRLSCKTKLSQLHHCDHLYLWVATINKCSSGLRDGGVDERVYLNQLKLLLL